MLPSSPPDRPPPITETSEGVMPGVEPSSPSAPPAPFPENSPPRNFWMIAGLCLFSLLWAGLRWGELSHWGKQEIEIRRQPGREYAYVLELNTANWLELALLEGIGEVLGKKIVADREQNGPFATVDELQRVKGIGLKKLEKLRPRLYVR